MEEIRLGCVFLQNKLKAPEKEVEEKTEQIQSIHTEKERVKYYSFGLP